MSRWCAAFAALVLVSFASTAQASSCRTESFEGMHYSVCSFDLAQSDLRIFWRDENRRPYRTFSALADDAIHHAILGDGRLPHILLCGIETPEETPRATDVDNLRAMGEMIADLDRNGLSPAGRVLDDELRAPDQELHPRIPSYVRPELRRIQEPVASDLRRRLEATEGAANAAFVAAHARLDPGSFC